MAQDTLVVNVGDSQVLIDCRNRIFPFTKSAQVIAHRFVVGTDFTSGYGMDIQLRGAAKVLFAYAKKGATGGALAIAESAITEGIQCATAVSDEDIEFFAVIEL